MTLLARRNDLLHAWHNVPMPYLVPHVVGTMIKATRMEFDDGSLRDMLTGWRLGLRACIEHGSRHPVSSGVYRLYRHLQKQNTMDFEDVVRWLPPPVTVS